MCECSSSALTQPDPVGPSCVGSTPAMCYTSPLPPLPRHPTALTLGPQLNSSPPPFPMSPREIRTWSSHPPTRHGPSRMDGHGIHSLNTCLSLSLCHRCSSGLCHFSLGLQSDHHHQQKHENTTVECLICAGPTAHSLPRASSFNLHQRGKLRLWGCCVTFPRSHN